VPLNNFVYDFVNLEPSRISRKRFRTAFWATLFMGGVLFAYLTTDASMLKNHWQNRPDLRAFPAMVPKDTMDITERTSLEVHY